MKPHYMILTFNLEQNVIGNGGWKSTGGVFTVLGTMGQSNAGSPAAGGIFHLIDGLWATENQTASSPFATVSGRVTRAGGLGIVRVLVTRTELSDLDRASCVSWTGKDRIRRSNCQIQAERYRLVRAAPNQGPLARSKINITLEETRCLLSNKQLVDGGLCSNFPIWLYSVAGNPYWPPASIDAQRVKIGFTLE